MKIFATAVFIIAFFYALSNPVIVSGGIDNDIAGRMCRMPDGRLLAIVERNPDWTSGDFFVSFSSDNGATWSAPDTVLVEPGNQSTHCVTVVNDTIYLFYASDESGYYKIFAINSTDGLNWSGKTRINLGWPANQSVYDPIVIVEEDGSLTMSYISMGHGAYAAHRPAGGTWDKDQHQIVPGGYRARICKHPDGTYLAAYHRNISGNYDIHIKTSSDLINWSAEVDITSNGNSHDAYCAVSPDNKYYLYYAKNTSGVYNLSGKHSDDAATWSIEEMVTADLTSNTQPSFFFDNDLLHLIWTHAINYDTNNDVYYENFDYSTVSIENPGGKEDICVQVYATNKNLVVNLQSHMYEAFSIVVYNISGRPVYYNQIFPAEKLTVNALKPGYYFITIESASYKKTIKTVIQ